MSTPPDDSTYLTLLGETRAALQSLTASAAEMRGSVNGALLGLHERMNAIEKRLAERVAALESHNHRHRDWVDVLHLVLLACIGLGIWAGVWI